jgi:hypothetical protein
MHRCTLILKRVLTSLQVFARNCARDTDPAVHRGMVRRGARVYTIRLLPQAAKFAQRQSFDVQRDASVSNRSDKALARANLTHALFSLYFFLDKSDLELREAPRHFMYYNDRVFLPLELRTMEWQRNLGLLNRSSLKEFEMPPYRDFFRAAEREYSWTRLGKPIAYVYNKFMRITSRGSPPMSFFSKSLLLSLVSKISYR